MDINEIEQGMIKVLGDTGKQLVEARAFNNTERTKAVLTNLTKFIYVYDPRLQVWSKRNDVDSTLNGWLYDLTVCDGRSQDDIDKVLVALESEWNADFKEIKYDFYKLVQSRSMLRVMIFQADDVNRTIDDLVKIVGTSAMTLSGDHYLFAGWRWREKEPFIFRPYVTA